MSGTTTVGYTAYGQRASEDNNNSSADRRDYFYDHRMRVRTITGNFFGSAGQIFNYTVTYAYDHKNRLVYRSYATSSTASQTYYYYDLNDRLIEVKNIPNSADTSTYSIYNFYWLDQRPVAMWAIDFPSQTVGRYFIHTDESNRVLEVYNWPTSGDATRVWAINPDEFGWDVTVVSTLGYQPLRLNNALLDDQVRAPQSFDAFSHVTTFDRPGLLVDHGKVYDPLLEVSLQPTRRWPDEAFAVSDHNPARDRIRSTVLVNRLTDPATAGVATVPGPIVVARFNDDGFRVGEWSLKKYLFSKGVVVGGGGAGGLDGCYHGGGPVLAGFVDGLISGLATGNLLVGLVVGVGVWVQGQVRNYDEFQQTHPEGETSDPDGNDCNPDHGSGSTDTDNDTRDMCQKMGCQGTYPNCWGGTCDGRPPQGATGGTPQ